MLHNTVMIQGTTSDVGKSLLVTALGRWFKQQGIKVAPFKPQNMALNSAVTEDGGEIGRAQAVQAQACGLAPHTDMNPILLKPCSDTGAQVIVHGHPIGDMQAGSFHDYKQTAMPAVLASHQRLLDQFSLVVVEGAGSPAEINLRANDIANMGFAEAVDCPVILIADIDRGGVFAHLVGTLELLSESEQARVVGFVINRFRGDISLLQPGLDWLEARTGKPVIGVLPYLQGLHLEAEDAIQTSATPIDHSAAIKVIVPVFPRISNHTDFDALRLHPQVTLEFIGPGQDLPPADLIILPGSKSVMSDLTWLHQQGWETHIAKHLRYGGKLLGICGGFQMLGSAIHDPKGVESSQPGMSGLGYLDIETTLNTQKQLRNVTGTLTFNSAPVSGYEIHAGISSGTGLAYPVAQLEHGPDGAISNDQQVLGSYLHGLFDQPEACDALLEWAGLQQPKSPAYRQLIEADINRLAQAVDEHLDTNFLLDLIGTKNLQQPV